MHSYSLHFIIALSASTVLSVIFCHTLKKKLLAFLVYPAFFYSLFYNYDYVLYLGSLSPIIIAYVGAIFSTFVFLFLSRLKVNKLGFKECKTNVFSIVAFFLFQYICVAYIYVIPWAIDTFPLSNVEAVLFTLFAGTNEGAEEFVISSFIEKVVKPGSVAFFVFFMLQLLVAVALLYKKTSLYFKLWKIKYAIYGNSLKRIVLQIQKIILVVVAVYCAIQSIVLPGIVMSSPFQALFQQPVDSELYRTHYIHPDSTQVDALSPPRNLIVIMLESMETNFAQYTPEIIELQKQNQNFFPGGVNVSGTSWTIAAITGKLCGIPLNMPMGIEEYLGKLPTYLPGAKCLMNILENKGFSQVYMQGSSGDFTQKRTFWTVHGNVAVHDIEYYKNIGKIPSDYHIFWGFEDRKLYRFAKEELDSLSKQGKPFALYMLTVDTHQPEGFLDDLCTSQFNSNEGKLPRVLRCTSKQLSDFLQWAKTQPWYKNTVISVMGDHAMPMLSPKANVSPMDSLYWVNFIINSAIQGPVRERQYSSLDVFPTLLESMGFALENRGIALGRSLYSDSLTMLELYGRHTLDSLLRVRSIQYDKFLFGEK